MRTFLPGKMFIALLVPLLLYKEEVPEYFEDRMVKYGAGEYVKVVPLLNAIDKNKVYPENPDSVYTFTTNWDSMSGNSLCVRQLYSRFCFRGFMDNAFSAMGGEDYWDQSEQGRSFVQNNMDRLLHVLKKKKGLFWKSVKKESKLQTIGFSMAKKQMQIAIDFEKSIIRSLQKMDESQLEKLAGYFMDYSAEYVYLRGEEENGTISKRKEINNYFTSMQGLYGWKNLRFINQSNGQPAIDHAWFFTISMMDKYKDKTYKKTLDNFLKIADAIL